MNNLFKNQKGMAGSDILISSLLAVIVLVLMTIVAPIIMDTASTMNIDEALVVLADTGTISSTDIQPQTDSTYSIGTTLLRYLNGWYDNLYSTNLLVTTGNFTNLVAGANGLDVNPGSDANADLITVGVTGSPKLSWNEAADTFGLNKSIIFGTYDPTALSGGSIVIQEGEENGIWAYLVNETAPNNVVCLVATEDNLAGATNIRVGGGCFTGELVLYGGAGINMFPGSTGTGKYILARGSTATNGQANDAPELRLEAIYDADATAGVTSTRWNGNILHDMITAGTTPKSQFKFNIGAVGTEATILGIENNNGTGAVYFYTADSDDYLQIGTVSNVPTIYGVGAYTRFGDASTTTHSLAAEDDVLITGKLEVTGVTYHDSAILMTDLKSISFGNGEDVYLTYHNGDGNANHLMTRLRQASANDVPVLSFHGSVVSDAYDEGLFDGVTQPLVSTIEKNSKYTSSATGTTTAGGATATLIETGKFANSVVGDVVRITAGTNCTAGWYWITTVSSANQVVLDRNFASNDTTNCTYLAYHSFTGVSADGLLTRITDGAPSDSSVEIDRDGWMILDVSQANGRLYWRANNGWHYVDATAGVSLPASERTDAYGHTFQIGDEVKLIVDKINDDGSYHALPVWAGSLP